MDDKFARGGVVRRLRVYMYACCGWWWGWGWGCGGWLKRRARGEGSFKAEAGAAAGGAGRAGGRRRPAPSPFLPPSNRFKRARRHLCLPAHTLSLSLSVWRTVVSMPMTLEPWPSSVMPKQPGSASESTPSRNASWCFRVPSLQIVPPQLSRWRCVFGVCFGVCWACVGMGVVA